MNSKRKKKYIIIIWIVLLIVMFGIMITLDFLKHKEMGSNQDILSQADRDVVYYNGEEYKYNYDLKNILFMGIDNNTEMEQQNSLGQGGQADCIILISIDKKKKTTTMLQISRDSMTEVDIYDMNGNYHTSVQAQIATQYAYGNSPKNSCWAMKKTVSEFLYELPIDGYVAIDIAAVSRINDMLGGVKITIPEDYTSVDATFVKGATLTLNGRQAEKYVRYRDTTITGDNEFRMRRQMQYIPALLDTFRNRTKNSEQEMEQLYKEVSPYIVTDLSLEELTNMSQYEWDKGNVEYLEGQIVAGEEFEEFHVDDESLQEQVMKTFYKLR